MSVKCNVFSHEWSFKDRDAYNFEWNEDEFEVIEQCWICKKERVAMYRLERISEGKPKDVK